MKLPEKAVSGIYKNNADVIVRMQRHRLVAVVRAQSSDQAYRIACAASDAGIWFVEITFTVPDALGVIERLALRNDLYVGAGTVLSKKDGKRGDRSRARDLSCAPIAGIGFDSALSQSRCCLFSGRGNTDGNSNRPPDGR